MATIAFLIENDEGHVQPTFALARRLASRGHRPVYLGLADSGDFIRGQGFEFTAIFEHLFPLGSTRTPRESIRSGAASAAEARPAETALGAEASFDRSWQALLDDSGLDRTIADLQPALFVLTSFCAPHALVLHNRYRFPVVLVNPILRTDPKSEYAVTVIDLARRTAGKARERFHALFARNGVVPQRAAELAPRVLAQLMRMRELILCPRDFELPDLRLDAEPEVHYVEAAVDLERRSAGAFPWELVDPARRLLYVSIGSSGRMAPQKAALFLRAVAAAFSNGRPDWQVVLATGGLLQPADLGELPPGCIAASWAPQIALLGRAQMAITQGGLGTIKECIVQGVPMVVFPLDGDQLDNARRIVQHGLGASGDLRTASSASIAGLVAAADRPVVRDNVERMRQKFLEIERSGVSLRLLEDLLPPA